MSAMSPKTWRKLVKQVQNQSEVKQFNYSYASAPGYESWPYTHAYMWSMYLSMTRIALDESIPWTREVETTAEAASCAMVALFSDAPFRHLGAELAKAFIATKPLPCTGEAQMPYPAFVLNLPKGLLLDDTGRNVNTLIVLSYNFWLHKCKEEKIPVAYDTKNMGDGGLRVTGLADDGTQLIRAVKWKYAHIDSPEDTCFYSGPNPDLLAKAIHKMMRIALNSMAAMTWKKDLLEIEYVTTGTGFGGHRYSQKQRPVYWIGKNYTRKHTATTHTQSTGGVKSPHWRSGHWHTIKHGQGRLKAKVLWFEPIYVNAAAKP